MGKQKSDGKKKKKKSSQLVIRIDAGERDAFVKLCDDLDTSAAREIRRFMRDWVAAHGSAPKAEASSDVAPEPAVEEVAAAEPAVEPAVVAEAVPEVVAEEDPPAKVRRKRKIDPAA